MTFDEWFNGSWEQDKHSCDYSWSKDAWETASQEAYKRCLDIVLRDESTQWKIEMIKEFLADELIENPTFESSTRPNHWHSFREEDDYD